MFWRKKKSESEKNYEKLLADLDSEIKKGEENLRQIRIRENKAIITWLYYSVPLYAVFLLVYGVVFYQSNDPWTAYFLKAIPLVLVIVLIWYIKKFISIWYKRQQVKEEERCITLKNEQKEMLEELKKKIKYYQTKNLIEKYEIPQKKQQPMMPGMNRNQMNPQMNNVMINQQQEAMSMKQLNDKDRLPMDKNHTVLRQKSMPVVIPRNPAGPMENSGHPSSASASVGNTPTERKWLDKLVDAIVGDVGDVDTKYALVCGTCYTHCGLALPEEFKTFKFICPNCKTFNDNEKKYQTINSPSKPIINGSMNPNTSQQIPHPNPNPNPNPNTPNGGPHNINVNNINPNLTKVNPRQGNNPSIPSSLNYGTSPFIMNNPNQQQPPKNNKGPINPVKTSITTTTTSTGNTTTTKGKKTTSTPSTTNKKPNLQRRPSTLLDEMDDTTDTTDRYSNSKSMGEPLKSEDSDHEIENQYDHEIEREKEVIILDNKSIVVNETNHHSNNHFEKEEAVVDQVLPSQEEEEEKENEKEINSTPMVVKCEDEEKKVEEVKEEDKNDYEKTPLESDDSPINKKIESPTTPTDKKIEGDENNNNNKDIANTTPSLVNQEVSENS